MTEGAQWSASFASASRDAMSVYDEIFVPRMFDVWAESLLDDVGLSTGESVLDVATGPGTVARQAAARVGPAGRVVATDLSPSMLEVAMAKPPVEGGAPIDYRQCGADALRIGDAEVDVVLCQQGLQFFPDRPEALREIYRALTPGGRVGASVWCAIAECPPFAGLAVAIGEVLGPVAKEEYERGPWGLTDRTEVADLFVAAGFDEVEVERRTHPVTFEGGPAQFLMTLAAASVAGEVAALGEEGQRALLDAAERALALITRDGAIVSEMAAHVITATR